MLDPGTHVGRYIVAEPIGRGAMGVVYAAHDPELDRRVAIKMLRHPSQTMHARLRREAQAMARLSHPNIVTVYDVGIADTGVFIAMDHVDGSTLRQWLADQPRTTEQVLAVFAYNVAQLPELLPRKPPKKKAAE